MGLAMVMAGCANPAPSLPASWGLMANPDAALPRSPSRLSRLVSTGSPADEPSQPLTPVPVEVPPPTAKRVSSSKLTGPLAPGGVDGPRQPQPIPLAGERRIAQLAAQTSVPLDDRAAALAGDPAALVERDITSLLPPGTGRGGPLTLEEVYDGVRRQFPPLLAARLERATAAGRLLSAQGGFDLMMTSKSAIAPIGFYEFFHHEFNVEQPTALWGATLTSGYRIQYGGVQPDYDKRRTNRGGILFQGVRIPLLQGGAIDNRRADLRQAEIDQLLVEPLIAIQRLAFLRAAGRAYFAWVAAGRRLTIAEDLLRIAVIRDGVFDDLFRRGLLAEAVVADNRRLVLTRKLGVAAAERRFQAAALALSLFVREELDASPSYADRDRLPEDFPTSAAPSLRAAPTDVATALSSRPELTRLRLQRERAEVDLLLARNTLLPNLDVSVGSTVHIGDKPYKDFTEYALEAGLDFKLPLQRRAARGRIQQIEAAIERIRLEETFATDRITNELRDALSDINLAHQQIDIAVENVRLNEKLEEIEAVAVRAGTSNLLFLNIREQNTADARAALVDATASYFTALVDYRAALGVDGFDELPPGPPVPALRPEPQLPPP